MNSRRVFDATVLSLMQQFYKVTGVHARDCIVKDDIIYYITDEKKARIAVGKEGKNIKTLRNQIKKDVKIIEFSNDPTIFAKNFIRPSKPKSVEINLETGNLEIKYNTAKERRYLLGDGQKKLKDLKLMINRYNPKIKDILVLQ